MTDYTSPIGPGPLRVSEDFYRSLVARARDRIPHLEFEKAYKAQDVFEWGYWGTLDNAHRSLAGRVLASMVVNQQLPLKFASCRLCTIKHYERIA